MYYHIMIVARSKGCALQGMPVNGDALDLNSEPVRNTRLLLAGIPVTISTVKSGLNADRTIT